MYKQEKYQREYLEKQILRITQEFEEILQKENKKMNDYKSEITTINEKLRLSQEIQESTSMKLKECELQRDELKRTILISNIHENSEKEKSTLLSLLQEKFEESEFQRKILKEKLENLNFSEDLKIPKFFENCKTCEKEFSDFKESQLQLQKTISILESEMESKTFEILKLENQIEKLSNSSKSLKSEIFSKNFEIEELKTTFEKHKKTSKNLENTNDLLTEQIKVLSEKLVLSKQKYYELEHKESQVDKSKLSSDNADERFTEYIKTYGVEHHFERVSEGVYTFGSKKVSITIKNGYLVCRVGGGYMMIEEFLKLIVDQQDKNEAGKRLNNLLSPTDTDKKSHKRSNTLFSYENEGAHSARLFEYEYNYNNPINGLKENSDSPRRHKLSPLSKQRAYTPFRKSICKRIFK